ncbi:MAG: 50S ribosomal protein L10 [Thermoguttaceae bacterium]|jgi:large subunit ribosomal protein L10
MSKYVKNLITDHLRERLKGVDDALLVNMVGMDANANNSLRAEMADKGIEVLVVKNSLAARATAGTSLDGLFHGVTGTNAICWGAGDIVALAKEIVRLGKDKRFGTFAARGGIMEGERLTSEQVEQVSKWPSREEQLSLLVGQILGPGATLAAQICGPGATLAGQVKQKGEGEEGETAE